MSVSQFVSCFLCELPLILRLGRKWKGLTGDNYKRTLNIEFEQDWSVGLGATLEADRKLKNISLVKMIFPGRADSAIFLRFECTLTYKIWWKSFEPFLRKQNFTFFSLAWLRFCSFTQGLSATMVQLNLIIIIKL